MNKKMFSLALLLALGLSSEVVLAKCGSCGSSCEAEEVPAKCKSCGLKCSDDDSGSCSSCGGSCGMFADDNGGKKSGAKKAKNKKSHDGSKKHRRSDA